MKFQDLFKFNKQLPKEERSFAYTPSGGLSFGNAFNKYNSLNLSAVYRCTELISDSVAMLPIHIKNFVSGEEYYNHPLANVFFDKVGSNINKYNLIKLLIQSCILRGNGYAFIQRGSDGSVKQIRFLPNETVTVQYNQQTDVLYYTSSLIKGKIEPANMIHIKKNTNNGITGISVLSYADRTIGISNSAENASKSFYDKGCNLSGILTVQGAMTKEQIQNARENWNQVYTDGGSGLAILQGSMSYSPIQVSAEDAQLLQTRQYNIKDIARFFGVPVGLLDASEQRYSLEELNMDFLIHTVQPYISVIEDEFNKKLLLPSERNYLLIDFEEEYIVRCNKTSMAQYYSTMLNCGILSINEVRHNLGLNKIEGGDEHHIAFVDTNKTNINQNKEDNEESKDI